MVANTVDNRATTNFNLKKKHFSVNLDSVPLN